MIELPPRVQTVLPIIQSLSGEQKLFIIKNLLDDDQPAQNLAWTYGEAVFGMYHSGQGDLSQNTKGLVSQKIRAKHGKDTH